MMLDDLTGRTIARWRVVDRAPDIHGATAWNCICECGARRVVRTAPIRNGKSQSCGCLAASLSSRRNATHGMHGSKEYKTWAQIKRRCRNPREKSYAQYGGVGIDICEEWARSFPAFFAAVGYAPSKTHSIDRIDNARGYEPGNCRWATKREQAQNRSTRVDVTAFGITKCKAEWARDTRCAVKLATMERRLWAGWAPERAISAPVRRAAQ